MFDNNAHPHRESWDEYFMRLAEDVATRSTCIRRHVGAVAVDTNTHRILGTGYNGSIPHYPHCTPDSCIRTIEKIPSGQQLDRCMAVHAEQNVILTLGIGALIHSTFYCTHQPCATCIKLLLSCQVTRIVWKHTYPDTLSRTLMKNYGYVRELDNGLTELVKKEYIATQED